MIITLPFPPTLNSYWRHVAIRGRPRTLLSESGRKYRRDVIVQCLAEGAPRGLQGPLACTIDLYPPCNRRKDCDNFAKALLDALTHAGVYGDDSQIVDLRIRMHPKRPPGTVVVTLEAVVDLPAHRPDMVG